VLFVSNNSYVPVSSVEDKLARFGIPAAGDVLTSAQAAAGLVEAGERALVVGGPGIIGELLGRGAIVVDADDDGPVDVVVVGIDPHFDYDRLRRATRAVREGARLVGTNDDATYPTADGLIPGAGSLLAAVRTAGGQEPVVAGKPYPAMAELARRATGGWDEAVMVGDRPDTDGRFARTLGCRFALVLTGVTTRAEVPHAEPAPDLVADDLAGIADALASVATAGP
jgi:4-nitrophenyl phosphatase